jgi:SacI restriction endonuclease
MSLSKSSVDHRTADRLLREAIALIHDDSTPISTTEWDTAIKTIIQGKHLTFRYILVTALLAKATNPGINALT